MQLRENGDTTRSHGPGKKSYPGRNAIAASKGAWKHFYRALACPGIFVMRRESTSTLPEIVRLAKASNQEAEACLSRYEDRLARGLAHVINILDPDVIVLGGGMSNIQRL